jgi:hypothetical protein
MRGACPVGIMMELVSLHLELCWVGDMVRN